MCVRACVETERRVQRVDEHSVAAVSGAGQSSTDHWSVGQPRRPAVPRPQPTRLPGATAPRRGRGRGSYPPGRRRRPTRGQSQRQRAPVVVLVAAGPARAGGVGGGVGGAVAALQDGTVPSVRGARPLQVRC